jgi:hypothetical protein
MENMAAVRVTGATQLITLFQWLQANGTISRCGFVRLKVKNSLILIDGFSLNSL